MFTWPAQICGVLVPNLGFYTTLLARIAGQQGGRPVELWPASLSYMYVGNTRNRTQNPTLLYPP